MGALCAVLLTNRSACALELGDAESALEDSTTALSLDQENRKAHFRRGKAAMSLKKYEEAYDAFRRTRQLAERTCATPDPALERLIAQCERHIPKWMRVG